MPAYFVVNSTITDAAKLEAYVQAAVATLGIVPVKLLALDAESETIEGTPAGSRTVILEFGSKDDFHTWYKSAEYQAIIDQRLTSTGGFAVLVNGA
jgi:uncharacterized protein (DUF1330 family)